MRKRRLFHFCNLEFGLLNLKKRRIKVSTFDALNDPFELLCHNSGDKEVRRKLQSFKDYAAKTTGILCFSKEISSPVQWAHYADRHTGICLGFDVSEEMIEDVVYTSERMKFEYDDEAWLAGPGSPAWQTFLTKCDHWSYENESRVFGKLGTPDVDTGQYFKGFDNDIELKEVAVGYQSKITRRELNDCLGDMMGLVETYKVRPAFTSYKMVRNMDESNWS